MPTAVKRKFADVKSGCGKIYSEVQQNWLTDEKTWFRQTFKLTPEMKTIIKAKMQEDDKTTAFQLHALLLLFYDPYSSFLKYQFFQISSNDTRNSHGQGFITKEHIATCTN